MKREPTRVLQLILDHPWAITQPALEQILAIIDTRVHEAVDLEAVSARLGRPLLNTGGRVEIRGSVAVIDVTGPIFRYANLFTDISGATSVEDLGQNLQAALDAHEVTRILLNVNSPGGQMDGINEMADMIHAASKVKPVTAYVGGLGASAAYWLASAAKRVVADESAFLGSIGVVVAVEDRGTQGNVKRYEFVSSQSPHKRPDPATESGRTQMQQMADEAAGLFIDRVAQFRGVTADHVIQNFGGGAVLMGRRAVKAGMADEHGSFEGLIEQLNSETQEAPIMAATNDAGNAPAPPASPPQATAETERARIAAILGLEEAQGREALAQQLALTPGIDAESAKRILAAAPKAAAAPANPLAAAMSQVANPKVGAGGEEDDSAAAEVNRILAFVPAKLKYPRAS